jgi:peptide chain release factor 2
LKKSVIHFDLPAITKEMEELNHRTTEPTFYDDFERSKEIMQSIKKLQSKLDRYEKLKSQAEDLEVLNALGEEENDATIIGEIKEGIERLRKTVESFKLEILLNGEYDTNNAILTLHAGVDDFFDVDVLGKCSMGQRDNKLDPGIFDFLLNFQSVNRFGR